MVQEDMVGADATSVITWQDWMCGCCAFLSMGADKRERKSCMSVWSTSLGNLILVYTGVSTYLRFY